MQFTPFVDDTRRGYRFAGDAVIEGLLSGVVSVPWQMASPPGFENLWRVPVVGTTCDLTAA